MRLLLDTHTLLWLLGNPSKLPPTAFRELQRPENELFLSIVSLWEMAIKSSKKALDLPGGDIAAVIRTVEEQEIVLLALEPPELLLLEKLPFHHRDPFDRSLIVQAQRHGLTLVSDDALFADYDITVLWR